MSAPVQSSAKDSWTPPPGSLGNLTIPQQHTLEKFRKELQENGKFDEKRHDDATLLRFLRARKFNQAASMTMLLNHEEWRQSFAGAGVDSLIKTFEFKEKPQVEKYYPQYYHKTDKEGRPVYIERLGKVNTTEMYKITSQDRLLQNLVCEYEKNDRDRLPACSKAVGHPVETSCTILDLAGVGVKQFWDVKNYVGEASKIGQDQYPETMGKFLLINAPWGFSTVWNIIKGWLDPVTQAKIKILGSSYQKELLESIDADSLPSDLGGTCRCKEGCSLSDAGPWNQPEKAKEESKEEESTEEVIKSGTAI